MPAGPVGRGEGCARLLSLAIARRPFEKNAREEAKQAAKKAAEGKLATQRSAEAEKRQNERGGAGQGEGGGARAEEGRRGEAAAEAKREAAERAKKEAA